MYLSIALFILALFSDATSSSYTCIIAWWDN